MVKPINKQCKGMFIKSFLKPKGVAENILQFIKPSISQSLKELGRVNNNLKG